MSRKRRAGADRGPALVVPPAEAGAAPALQVGGPAALLGNLARAGLPIAPGFCVTAEAYRRHLAQPAIAPALDALHRPLAGYTRTEGAPAPSADLLARLRRRVSAVPLPPAVAQALAEAHDSLPLENQAALLVRLSPIGEPLAAYPLDGAREAVGLDELSDAIRELWAGLWAEAAAPAEGERHAAPGLVGAGALVTGVPAGAARGGWAGRGPFAASEGGQMERETLGPDAQQRLAALGAQAAAVVGAPIELDWYYDGGEFRIIGARLAPTAPAAPRSGGRRLPRAAQGVAVGLVGAGALALLRRLTRRP